MSDTDARTLGSGEQNPGLKSKMIEPRRQAHRAIFIGALLLALFVPHAARAGMFSAMVVGAGNPIVGSTVTVYAAGSSAAVEWVPARLIHQAPCRLQSRTRAVAPFCTRSPPAVMRAMAPTLLSL